MSSPYIEWYRPNIDDGDDDDDDNDDISAYVTAV